MEKADIDKNIRIIIHVEAHMQTHWIAMNAHANLKTF